MSHSSSYTRLWAVFAAILLVNAANAYGEETFIDSVPGARPFPVPDNVREVTVKVWGGGGAGGEITSRGATGGGGGGAYARSVVAVEPGNVLSYMVGRGGVSGQAASDSWVGFDETSIFARAEAGASGPRNDSDGGRGGRASESIGNPVFSGGVGADGDFRFFEGRIGGGGGSSAGDSGHGIAASGSDGANGPDGGAGIGGDGYTGFLAQGSGSAGSGPGGGGGGSTTIAIFGGNYDGGAGGDGQVKITYEYSPFLGPPVDNLIIYSGAAITMGASSIVGGNIQVNAAATLGASSTVSGYVKAGAAVTLGATVKVDGYIEARDAGTIGADSTIGGYLTTGDAATLGANTIDGNIMVGGDLTAGAAILVGTKAVIAGNLRSGAAASADLGADAIVRGNATAGTALTLGADVIVDGHAQAGTGALMLGVNAKVAGNAKAGTSVTLAAGATVVGNITEGSIEQFTNDTKKPIDDQSARFGQVQTKLAAIVAPQANQLPTSMTVSRTLTKGVYHTTALTTTADITLTFDGKGVDGHWLINSDTFIAFGASTKIVLKDVTPNSTITWNAGSYTDAGANSNLMGTFFAGSYILTGASTTLKGAGNSCGGLFATTGAVTLGASNTIGAVDCTGQPTAQIDHYQIIHDGQGITCNPETVTIKACTNAYDGSCTLSDEVVTLDVKATGSRSVAERIRFIGTGIASIPYRLAETAILSLENASITAIDPTVCFDGSNVSCDLVFAESGLFLEIDNHTSGKEIEASILAVKAGEENPGQCVPAFTGEKNIQFTTDHQNPALGTLIVEYPGESQSGSELTLDFNSSGLANYTVQYKDVGKVRLKALYEGAGDEAGLVMDGRVDFVARPDRFEVVVPGSPNDLNLGESGKFRIAGQSFDIEVLSLNILDKLTPNFGKESPREGVVLNVVEAPAAPVPKLPALQGALGLFGESCAASEGGKACGKFSWPEVGAFALDPALASQPYLDSEPVTGEILEYVGRFYPSYFDYAIEGGTFSSESLSTDRTSCMGSRDYVYTGEPFSWGVTAEVTITPKNLGGVTVENYSGTQFQLLFENDVTFKEFTVQDSDAKGVDSSALEMEAVLGTPSLDTGTEGDLIYAFSGGDEFWYPKSRNARVPGFTPQPVMTLLNIVDSDGVTVKNPATELPESFTPAAAFKIRYGRIALENSYGPEDLERVIPLIAEVYGNNGFEPHEDESCWFYDLPENTIVNYDDSEMDSSQTQVVEVSEAELNLDNAIPKVSPGNYDYRLRLSASGQAESPEKKGVYVELDAGSDWLKDYWDADNPDTLVAPYAWATFGVYRGNDRIIYWREVR